MKPIWPRLRRKLLGIAPEETSFARRGFRGGGGGMRERLEQVGVSFTTGYHAALEEDELPGLEDRLAAVQAEWAGFAFEGAAMGLALRDWLTPWRRDRVAGFLRGAGAAHAYMIHVGVGWAWARLPVNPARARTSLDPLLGWLAFDGYGFHEAFFKWRAYLGGGEPPRKVTGYGRRAFDQGFGRCLWFVDGGDVELIARDIATFPAQRRPDLWGGVGLAATYAGGATAEGLRRLRELAGAHQSQLAQGAAFAAKARRRAGNLVAYTDLATAALCGMDAVGAARVTDHYLEQLLLVGTMPAYEAWRQLIQSYFEQQQRNSHPKTVAVR